MTSNPAAPASIDGVRPSSAALDAYIARNFNNLPEQAEPWAALNEDRAIQPVRTANATAGVRDEISRYPGWIQTLIIESDLRINGFDADGFRGNARGYGFAENNNGYFMPSRGTPTLANSVNVPVDGSISDTRGTIRHEVGHALDEFIRGQSYLSETSERWRAAIEAELGAYRGDVMLGLDRSPSNRDPSFMRQPLHPHDDRSIGFHLSLPAYTPDNYPTEAFAEMFRHYTSLMDVHMGNEATVDRVLSESYQHAWPVFRDELLPAMQEKAIVIHTSRQRLIANAVATAADAAEMQGRPMTEEAQRALAIQLETQRTSQIEYFNRQQNDVVNIFEDRLNILDRPEFVHEDGVIQNYVEARRDYDRAVHQEEAFRTRPDFNNQEFLPTPITTEEHERLRPIIEEAERIIGEKGRAGLYEEAGRVRAAQELIDHHRGTEPPLVRDDYRLPSQAESSVRSAKVVPNSEQVRTGRGVILGGGAAEGTDARAISGETAPDRRSDDSVGAHLRSATASDATLSVPRSETVTGLSGATLGGAAAAIIDTSNEAYMRAETREARAEILNARLAGLEQAGRTRQHPLGTDNMGRPLPTLGETSGLKQPAWAEGIERLPRLDMDELQRDLRDRGLAELGGERPDPREFGRKGVDSANAAGGVVQPDARLSMPPADGAGGPSASLVDGMGQSTGGVDNVTNLRDPNAPVEQLITVDPLALRDAPNMFAQQAAPPLDTSEHYRTGNAITGVYQTSGVDNGQMTLGQADSYRVLTSVGALDEAGISRALDGLSEQSLRFVQQNHAGPMSAAPATTGILVNVSQGAATNDGANFDVVMGSRGDSHASIAHIDANGTLTLTDLVRDVPLSMDHPAGEFGPYAAAGENNVSRQSVRVGTGEQAVVLVSTDGLTDAYLGNRAQLQSDISDYMRANPESFDLSKFLTERATGMGATDNTTVLTTRLTTDTNLNGNSITMAAFDGLGHTDGRMSSDLAANLDRHIEGARSPELMLRTQMEHVASPLRRDDVTRAMDPASVDSQAVKLFSSPEGERFLRDTPDSRRAAFHPVPDAPAPQRAGMASVGRVVKRDASTVLPVAANDTGVASQQINTAKQTPPPAPVNDIAPVPADAPKPGSPAPRGGGLVHMSAGSGTGVAMGGVFGALRYAEGGSMDTAQKVGGNQLAAEINASRADIAGMAPDAAFLATVAASKLAPKVAPNLASTLQGAVKTGARLVGPVSLLAGAGVTYAEMQAAEAAQDGRREAGALYAFIGGVTTGAGTGAGYGLVGGGPWGILIAGVGGGVVGGYLASEDGRRSQMGDQMQRDLDHRAQIAVDASIVRLREIQSGLSKGEKLDDSEKRDVRAIFVALLEQHARLEVLYVPETDIDGQLRRDFQLTQTAKALNFLKDPNAEGNALPLTSRQTAVAASSALPALVEQINARDGELQWKQWLDQDRFGKKDGVVTVAEVVKAANEYGLDLYTLDKDGRGLQLNELLSALHTVGVDSNGVRNGRSSIPNTAPLIADSIHSSFTGREGAVHLNQMLDDLHIPGLNGQQLRGIMDQYGISVAMLDLKAEGRISEGDVARAFVTNGVPKEMLSGLADDIIKLVPRYREGQTEWPTNDARLDNLRAQMKEYELNFGVNNAADVARWDQSRDIALDYLVNGGTRDDARFSLTRLGINVISPETMAKIGMLPFMDANHDGKIDFDKEARPWLAKHKITFTDTNGNNLIDVEEFAAALPANVRAMIDVEKARAAEVQIPNPTPPAAAAITEAQPAQAPQEEITEIVVTATRRPQSSKSSGRGH